MNFKYRVTLTSEEREQLSALIGTGKAAARKLLHARILLKADRSSGDAVWTDARIAAALDCGTATIERVRQRFVEEGLAAALNPQKPRNRQFRKLDGAQEAHLVAVACSAPPEGRARWTLNLLADKLVELKIVDSISSECVRTTLKKRTEALVEGAVGSAAGEKRRIRLRDGRYAGSLSAPL
jgi:transposase